jgi:hypothetical protein
LKSDDADEKIGQTEQFIRGIVVQFSGLTEWPATGTDY